MKYKSELSHEQETSLTHDLTPLNIKTLWDKYYDAKELINTLQEEVSCCLERAEKAEEECNQLRIALLEASNVIALQIPDITRAIYYEKIAKG